MKYDVIIGLEIHAELKTKSKMFCACDNNIEGKPANTNVCPICLGHPGALPYPNKKAIEMTILAGLALNCQVNKISKFDRKNYFYPDLPKGYQISQFDLPLVYDGFLEIDEQKIKITRIHLEEDTAKSSHPNKKNYSLIDFNRSSTPLMEMVTEPVIPNAQIAKKFCQRYQQILRYLNLSNADMEKGEMRCEANVSIQEPGRWEYLGNCEIKALGDYKLNSKVEIKNINSFKAIEKAIEYEIRRQILAKDNQEEIVQETRGWDENKQETVRQRSKETSADYRYFPEPDIPPLEISEDWIKEIKSKLIELPQAKAKRFINEYGLRSEDVEILVNDKNLANYSEQVFSELEAWIKTIGGDWEKNKQRLIKTATNWLLSELLKHLKENSSTVKDMKITAENFAELIALLEEKKINSSAGQSILTEMFRTGGDPSHIMEEKNLQQMDNSQELEDIIKEVLLKNSTQVEEYKAGKNNVLQYLIGQTMAATKGKANPALVSDILKKLIL